MTQKRNIAEDIRAASLTLRPRPQQTNSYGKGFEFRAALTDMDHVERNRILQCIAMRNKSI